jgi:hypothetical protein
LRRASSFPQWIFRKLPELQIDSRPGEHDLAVVPGTSIRPDFNFNKNATEAERFTVEFPAQAEGGFKQRTRSCRECVRQVYSTGLSIAQLAVLVARVPHAIIVIRPREAAADEVAAEAGVQMVSAEAVASAAGKVPAIAAAARAACDRDV